jgi:ribonuclease BN (tRNA processing enzyme)
VPSWAHGRLPDRDWDRLAGVSARPRARARGSAIPLEPEWTSGFDLARGVDLLLHDAQYTREEYPRHVGWGHSTIHDALAFARLAGVKHLVPFHHDPGREDAALEAAVEAAVRDVRPEFPVTPAAEGARFELG